MTNPNDGAGGADPAAVLALIRERATAEITRRRTNWRDPTDTRVCQALEWAVFGRPWPASEDGPDGR